MAAWNHSSAKDWGAFEVNDGYRQYVTAQVPGFRGRHEDCADLSMMLLIDYAAANGLAVTFEDNAGRRYISKAEGVVLQWAAGSFILATTIAKWSTKEEFTKIVQRRIGVEALWNRNTLINVIGPQPGDLMLIYKSNIIYASRHHAALVYRVYVAGEVHPKRNEKSIPDFPGADEAEEQTNQTEYFRGTVDEDGITLTRNADKDVHFDYLNSRSHNKRNAELIYFANKRQMVDEGFQFRVYGPQVQDDWFDWDGQGAPPR